MRELLDDWGTTLFFAVTIGAISFLCGPLVGLLACVALPIAGLVCVAWPVDRMFGGKGGQW